MKKKLLLLITFITVTQNINAWTNYTVTGHKYVSRTKTNMVRVIEDSIGGMIMNTNYNGLGTLGMAFIIQKHINDGVGIVIKPGEIISTDDEYEYYRDIELVKIMYNGRYYWTEFNSFQYHSNGCKSTGKTLILGIPRDTPMPKMSQKALQQELKNYDQLIYKYKNEGNNKYMEHYQKEKQIAQSKIDTIINNDQSIKSKSKGINHGK